MRNILFLLLLLTVCNSECIAQFSTASVFYNPFSIEGGITYSRLIGGNYYKNTSRLSEGYGYYLRGHAFLKGMNNLGVTFGWGKQLWSYSGTDSLNQELNTSVSAGTWALGLKYYPFKRFYFGGEATFNNLKLKKTAADITESANFQLGNRLSMNTELVLLGYAGQLSAYVFGILPLRHPALYGWGVNLSIRY